MNNFSECENGYTLARGGWVRFKADEIQSVTPKYENTIIVLRNGMIYLLKGRGFGV